MKRVGVHAKPGTEGHLDINPNLHMSAVTMRTPFMAVNFQTFASDQLLASTGCSCRKQSPKNVCSWYKDGAEDDVNPGPPDLAVLIEILPD